MEQDALVTKFDFPEPMSCSYSSKGCGGSSCSFTRASTSANPTPHKLMDTMLSLHAHFDDQDTCMHEL